MYESYKIIIIIFLISNIFFGFELFNIRMLEVLQECLQNLIYFLYRLTELQVLHNETQMSMQEMKHVLKNSIDQGNEGIESRISENKEETRDSITNLRYAINKRHKF